MDKKIKAMLAILGFAALLAGAYFAYEALTVRTELPINTVQQDLQRAPDITVLDQNGNEVRLSELIGTAVVLNFWTSWCPACVQETPYFDALYREMGGEVRILKVNLTDGQRETQDSALDFVNSRGYAFPVYFDTTGQASGAYGVMAIPVTFFINAEGYVTSGIRGAATADSLRLGVESLR